MATKHVRYRRRNMVGLISGKTVWKATIAFKRRCATKLYVLVGESNIVYSKTNMTPTSKFFEKGGLPQSEFLVPMLSSDIKSKDTTRQIVVWLPFPVMASL